MLDSIDSDLLIERFRMVNQYLDENLDDVNNKIRPGVRHLPDAGGKRIRPILFLLLSEALGQDSKSVLPIAAGIESFHTSTLVQDDHPDMDNDNMRRGVPTVHREFSPSESQFVANILMSKSFSWISRADVEPETESKCIEEMDGIVEDLCVGQKLDLKYEEDMRVGKSKYKEMVSMKTASIYEGLCRMAFYVSSYGESEYLNHIASFGYHLGMSFQMVDDVIDMKLSDTTGKDAFSDIVNKKITIVTVHAMENGIPVFDEEIPVRKRVEMVREAGSIDYGRSLAEEHTQEAMHHLNQVPVENDEFTDVIEEILELVVTRSK